MSSNQEIPGQLGNNINGVTNLDLTGQEEIITSGLYDDGWDESSSSGFEDLPLDEDIILDALCETNAAKINNKYDNKVNKVNRKFNRKRAKLDREKKVSDHNNIGKAAKRDYHKDMANNTSGLRKMYHNHKAKKIDKKLGKTTSKINNLQKKRKEKLASIQKKRAKKLS